MTTIEKIVDNRVNELLEQEAQGDNSMCHTYYFSGKPKTKTDKNGAVTKAVLPGETAEYAYTAGGFVKSIAFIKTRTEVGNVSYEYYADGNVKSYNLHGSERDYDYDNAGRLVKEESDNRVDTYTYDAFGNRILQARTTEDDSFTL